MGHPPARVGVVRLTLPRRKEPLNSAPLGPRRRIGRDRGLVAGKGGQGERLAEFAERQRRHFKHARSGKRSTFGI